MEDRCWELGRCNWTAVETLLPWACVDECLNAKSPMAASAPYPHLPEQSLLSWSEGLYGNRSVWQCNVTFGKVTASSESCMKWKILAWCRGSMYSTGWYPASSSNKGLLHRFSTSISSAVDIPWAKSLLCCFVFFSLYEQRKILQFYNLLPRNTHRIILCF